MSSMTEENEIEDLVEENREALEQYAAKNKEASELAEALLQYYELSLINEETSMSDSITA